MGAEPLTAARIRRRVERLRRAVAAEEGDEENWHYEADAIALEALEAIRGGCAEPRRVAAEALKADAIQFGRWYA